MVSLRHPDSLAALLSIAELHYLFVVPRPKHLLKKLKNKVTCFSALYIINISYYSLCIFLSVIGADSALNEPQS